MNSNKYILITVIVIIVLIYLSKKKILKMYNDLISISRVKNLHPLMVAPTFSMLEEAKKLGIDLRVAQGLRTIQEQNELYNQGRKNSGKIVTNAKGGDSFHNYGLAFDVVIMDEGQPNWNYNDKRWAIVGKLGKKYGFKWGGDWIKKDYPHFEYNISLAKIKDLYKSGEIDGENFVKLT